MPVTAEKVRSGCADLSERASDVWQRASRMTEDAGALTAAAKEVIDDTVESVRRQARELKHVPDDVAYHVRRAPFRAMGGAMMLGLISGAVVGWVVAGIARRAAARE